MRTREDYEPVSKMMRKDVLDQPPKTNDQARGYLQLFKDC